MLIGLAFRFYNNTAISLWHDEAFSVLLLRYPWGEMFYRIGLDVHPPAYYVFLRLWSYAFGDSLLALRGFSVLFGLLGALMTYLITARLTKSKPFAVIAGLLVLLNPFQIQYATEARMYTFGAFLSLWAAYLLIKALDGLSSDESMRKLFLRFSAFGLVAGAAALTHYYLLFTVLALCGYAFLYALWKLLKIHQWNKMLALVWACVFIGGIFSSWIGWFLYQVKQVGAGYWIPPLNIWSIPTTLWQIMFGVGVDIQKLSTRVGVVVLTVAVLWILVRQAFSSLSHRWLLLLSFLAPFGGSLLFALMAKLKGSETSVFLVRYFLFASGFLAVILASYFAGWKRKIFAYAVACLLLVLNVYIFVENQRDLWSEPRPGMAALTQVLVDNAKQKDLILSASSFEYFNLKYYLAQKVSPFYSNATNATLPAKVTDGLVRCEIDCLVFSKTQRPKLYSGGKTSIKQMSHFEGTAILTDSDLFPDFLSVPNTSTVWVVWTNGFGGSKPTVPGNWVEVEEHGFAEVRPYLGTWVVLTKYQVGYQQVEQ